MQFQEQEYLDENIYHHKYFLQHCNCTITHQAAELKNKPTSGTPGQEFIKNKTPNQKQRGYLQAEEISSPKQKLGQHFGLNTSYSKQESLVNKDETQPRFLLLCQPERQYYSDFPWNIGTHQIICCLLL